MRKSVSRQGNEAGRRAAKTVKRVSRDAETAARNVRSYTKSFVDSFRKELKKK